MTNTAIQSETAPASPNLLARFIGIITAPRATYEAVVARPTWLGMLALTALVSAALLGGFLFTEAGQRAWLDAAASGPFAGEISDEQYAAMEKMAAYVGYGAIGQAIVGMPLVMLLISGVVFAVFSAFGGDARFKQVFAVVVHSFAVLTLGSLFTVPMNYLRGTLTSQTSIGVLLPMIDDTSFLGRLLGMVDLFWVWWVFVLAIGLAVLYRRRTQPIATTLFAIYACIALGIAFFTSK
jgi:hypothetical protein